MRVYCAPGTKTMNWKTARPNPLEDSERRILLSSLPLELRQGNEKKLADGSVMTPDLVNTTASRSMI